MTGEERSVRRTNRESHGTDGGTEGGGGERKEEWLKGDTEQLAVTA